MGAFGFILLAVLSGILNGSYATPIKIIGKWEWENIWLWFAISGLLILPWISAFSFISDVGEVMNYTSAKTTGLVFLFGLGWGIGSVAFGLALHLIGFSLGYTLMMGLIAVIGALIPILVKDPSSLVTQGGIVMLFSLLLTTVGIIFCGSAGKSREKTNKKLTKFTAGHKSNFREGLILCFVSGLFSAMLNFSFDFGTPLSQFAMKQLGEGANMFRANSIIWAVALSGGFVPFAVYSLFLLRKNRSVHRFWEKRTRKNYFLTISMGIIFYASLLCYGWAASALGKAGTTVGWVIFTAGAITTANIWGLFTAEWKGVPQKALNKMF
jgi:L-rhamnose-H+ transport protein